MKWKCYTNDARRLPVICIKCRTSTEYPGQDHWHYRAGKRSRFGQKHRIRM